MFLFFGSKWFEFTIMNNISFSHNILLYKKDLISSSVVYLLQKRIVVYKGKLAILLYISNTSFSILYSEEINK